MTTERRLIADARWLDALGGDFYPPTDPEHRAHKLSRLAVATMEKGIGPEDCRDYVPSWAPDTYAMLEQSGGEEPTESSLTIAEITGRWPRVISFGHEITSLTNNHYLIIRERGLEAPYQLDGSMDPGVIQRDVAEIAQDFYDGLRRAR